MNSKTAEQYIQFHCGPGRENADARIRRALRFAANDDNLREKLDRQLDLDGRASEWITGIGLPTDLEDQFRAAEQPSTRSFSLRRALWQPPALAVIIALTVLLGWFIYSTVLSGDNFPGRDSVQQMLDSTSAMTGTEFDPKSAEAGLLGDWLFSQYGFENYFLPPELGHLKTAGCRVFKQDGFPVAQIAVLEHQSFLFVFGADDFGVKIHPADRWRVFQSDDWSVGILSHDDVCVMVAFHGTGEEMRRFLAGGK